MAGNHNARTVEGVSSRSYTPDASKGWVPLGFVEFDTRMTQGLQDVRTPVVSNQMPRLPFATYPGMQLRQPLSLLSQKFNVAFADHTFKEYQPQAVQLATNKVSTGLGIGTLKNLDVNAKSKFSNLRAKATAFGRLSQRIPVN